MHTLWARNDSDMVKGISSLSEDRFLPNELSHAYSSNVSIATGRYASFQLSSPKLPNLLKEFISNRYEYINIYSYFTPHMYWV